MSGSYGGIAFEVPASAQVVDSVHILYDEKSGFSSLMKMVDRDPAQTLHERTGSDNKPFTLWAPMLALSAPDLATGFPAGTVLQPTILVRNVTAKKQVASITVSWRGDSGKGRSRLPELILAPFETRQIQVGAMQKQLGIPNDAHWALVTLTTPAMPDELIAVASSYDSTLRYGMQAPFYAGLGDHFVGGEWRVDTTHNELMAMTNVGTRPTDALLTLYYDKGKEKYEMQQKIEPGDQMWLNFADLIHRRVADRKGRVLPADLASGTYDLRDLNPGKGGNLIGSELALDTTLGQQAGPDILRCCGYENPGPFPSIEEILFLQSSPLDVQALDCNGNEVQISNYFGDWWSGNTSVAQVTYRNVYGAGPGSTYGDASGEVPIGNAGYCTVKLEQVQVPITVWQLSLLCDPHLVIGNNMVAPSSTGTCTASITPQGINLPGVYSWSVSNQNLTVPNSNQASVTETAKSASGSPDDTVVTVKYTPNDGSGAKSVTAAVTVHKPTSLAVDSDTTTPNGIAYNVPCLDPNHKSTCGATSQQCSDPSYLRVRTYDVQDQFTPPNKLSYFGLNDSVNTETFPITTTCPNQQFDSGIPTRGTIFKDQFFLCSTCCLAGGPGCTLDSNPKQVIYVDGWDVREVQAHYDCSSATLNP